MNRIILTAEHRRAIAKQGEALYPQECSGLLLGHLNGITKEVIDLMFVDPTDAPESTGFRYHIPSQQMQAGEELAQSKGLEILGSFHSHIDEPARPSIQDRELAEPSFSYVIVGVRQGRAHELASWNLSEDRTAFFQEDIRAS